jgi:urease accessory protein
MILVEKPLGNAADPAWAQLLEGAAVDSLNLDQSQAQENQFSLRTAGGVEVAVALTRDTRLRDGDVLVWDEPNLRAIVARVSP